MAGEILDFFRRFTTLVGAASPGQWHVSETFEAGDLRSLVVTELLIRATHSPDIDFHLDTSMDGEEWREMLAGSLLPGDVYGNTCPEVPGRFVRARILVIGADGVATLWLQGIGRSK